MKLYIGVTDYSWFRFLQERQPDEVNFWKPGGASNFRAIDPGSPFLFKLHKPRHYIVGGGFFTGFVRLPLSSAWEAFGEKNGTNDFTVFEQMIRGYNRRLGREEKDPEIGCILLNSPFFLEESDWIPAPDDWANSIVQGKTFDMQAEPGISLWTRVSALLQKSTGTAQRQNVARETSAEYYPGPVFGSKYLRLARLGQGTFRALTLQNYKRQCCVTGENTLPVLQAAHIKPVTQSGTHSLRNGLLLRADLHILYDQGLIGITPDYHVQISPRIREQFLNGKVYYAHHGKEMVSCPDNPDLRPDPELLDWHMQKVFVR